MKPQSSSFDSIIRSFFVKSIRYFWSVTNYIINGIEFQLLIIFSSEVEPISVKTIFLRNNYKYILIWRIFWHGIFSHTLHCAKMTKNVSWYQLLCYFTLLVNALVSRNFCHKSVTVIFRVSHSVENVADLTWNQCWGL